MAPGRGPRDALSLISAAIGRLVRLDQFDRNPVAQFRRPKEPKKMRAVLSKSECAQRLDALRSAWTTLMNAPSNEDLRSRDCPAT